MIPDIPTDAPDPFPDVTPQLLDESTVEGLIQGRDTGVGLILRKPDEEAVVLWFWGTEDVTVEPLTIEGQADAMGVEP